MDFLKNVKKYWRFSVYSAKSQLRGDVGSLRLGWIWWILEPALFMCVYAFVFTSVFGKQMEYLMAYISAGLMLWQFFNRCISGSVTLIKRYSGMLGRVYIPKYVLMLSSILLSAFKMCFSLVIVIFFVVFYGIPFRFGMFLSILPVLVLVVLTFGIGLLVMHFGVYFPDLKKIVPVVLKVLFYFSGVFYSLDRLSGVVGGTLLKLNPIGVLLMEARNVLLYGQTCDWTQLLIWLLVGLALCVVGVKLITRYEAEYLKVI